MAIERLHEINSYGLDISTVTKKDETGGELWQRYSRVKRIIELTNNKRNAILRTTMEENAGLSAKDYMKFKAKVAGKELSEKTSKDSEEVASFRKAEAAAVESGVVTLAQEVNDKIIELDAIRNAIEVVNAGRVAATQEEIAQVREEYGQAKAEFSQWWNDNQMRAKNWPKEIGMENQAKASKVGVDLGFEMPKNDPKPQTLSSRLQSKSAPSSSPANAQPGSSSFNK